MHKKQACTNQLLGYCLHHFLKNMFYFNIHHLAYHQHYIHLIQGTNRGNHTISLHNACTRNNANSPHNSYFYCNLCTTQQHVLATIYRHLHAVP